MTMSVDFLRLPLLASAMIGCIIAASHAQPANPVSYANMAAEVTESIHSKFWLGERGLYARAIDTRSPDFIWGGGVMFSALATAARHDSKYQDIMFRNFNGMEVYWDTKVPIPGYEPAPTSGGGNDKYYDDNAWMVICFIEAYEITGDMRYLKRAGETSVEASGGMKSTRTNRKTPAPTPQRPLPVSACQNMSKAMSAKSGLPMA